MARHNTNRKRATAAATALTGAAAAITFALPASLYAQDEVRLPPTVVTGTRVEQPVFDLPMSIDSVEREQIQEQQLQVNVSENLVRVPGAVVQNRHIYAQELQISLRGFGARSQFGVRGIKLIADGIPASTPDGQGGTGLFSLSSAQRIEVLRGPFSALYGNHSGGVIQIFTEDGPARPTLTPSAAFGSYDTSRYGFKFGGDTGGFNYILDASAFETDGYREHSAASRDHINSKFRWSLDGGSTLTLVANAFDQPNNQDPLGLTAEEVQQDRRQAAPAALDFNTRRSLDNAQTGLVYEQPLGENDTLRLLGYAGQRSNEQFLAFPGDTQPTQSGGVSVIDRDFGGLGARWTHRTTGETPLTVTTGVDYDIAKDVRTGFTNNNGVKGELRRDEDNTVDSWGAYVQTEKWLTSKWSVSGGLRYTKVNFESEDRFIIDGVNPDDSGSASHDAWTPVVGVLYRLNPALNLYANAGRSFETPTFIEIAFRPDGSSGLNFELEPSTSNHYEVGLKAFAGADTRINLALFAIDTRNEIVVGESVFPGRATFRNAGDTERRGIELLVDSNLGGGFTTYFAYTYIDAIFADSFTTPDGTVESGNQIPAVPRNTLYGELAWRHRPSGFSTAVEARWHDKVYVDDLNSEFAPSYTVANVRAGLEQTVGDWRFTEFARVDNVFDKEYIGAVIVNDGNGRFYAPAPTRNYLVGFTVARAF